MVLTNDKLLGGGNVTHISAMPEHTSLQEQLGQIDIYLFDQLLKGRFDHCQTIFDAGCGNGRNLVYFLRSGFEVFAIDRSPVAVEQVQRLAAQLAPALPAENFRVSAAEEIPFPDGRFNVVISNAVLHFAADEQHFEQMLNEMWRVLGNGGMLFARLASNIGIEQRVELIEGRRYRLPDGTDRFLVDEAMLLAATQRLGGTLFEPLKTSNVQNLRCMTTWCLRKEG